MVCQGGLQGLDRVFRYRMVCGFCPQHQSPCSTATNQPAPLLQLLHKKGNGSTTIQLCQDAKSLLLQIFQSIILDNPHNRRDSLGTAGLSQGIQSTTLYLKGGTKLHIIGSVIQIRVTIIFQTVDQWLCHFCWG